MITIDQSQSAIKKALEKVRMYTPECAEEAESNLVKAFNVMNALITAKATLLPVESKSADEMDNQISDMRNQSNHYASLCRRNYDLLGLEVFKIRNSDNTPALGIFDLELSDRANICQMGIDERGNFEIHPDLPDAMEDLYQDVEQKLNELRQNALNKNLHGAPLLAASQISATFNGMIPINVKKEIFIARSRFRRLFLLGEVKDWKVESTVRPDPDPLIIGWDGANCWLVKAFNMTPFENYLQKEFVMTR